MQIYADNAATTRMSRTAMDAMISCMEATYANPSSLHYEGQKAGKVLSDARRTVAECLGCDPEEITFTSGGSEADNQAIISAAYSGREEGRNHIITTPVEHHAVLHTLDRLKEEGFEVTYLPVSATGMVTAEQVAEAITPRTCLVTVMFANNEIGTIMPVEEIGAVCREKGVVFHTDAVQAVGHVHVDVRKQNIDMLSLSGHKFHGPKGIGALYSRRDIPLVSVINGGGQERGRRAGTENIPAIAGMAAAMEEAVENLDKNSEKIIQLRDRIIKGLSSIEHSVLNGEPEKRLPSNINFCFEGIEGEAMLMLLSDKGVCVSAGSACTASEFDPSHVLMAIGRPHSIAQGSVRISLSEYSTEEEAVCIIRAVEETVAHLRKFSPVWRDLKSGKTEFVIK